MRRGRGAGWRMGMKTGGDGDDAGELGRGLAWQA